MRIPTVILLVVAAHASARTQAGAAADDDEARLAVIVGANVGLPEDDRLRYAEADARRMRDLLVELAGVRSDRALLVLGGGPNEVLRALTEVSGRAAEIGRSGRRVVLFFYYSGHGREDALHLPRGALPLEALRRELAGVPANLRLVVLDACRTGGRAKGVRRAPPFALAVTVTAPAGTVEIRAAADGEAAQESEELAGAIFTHFLLSGLRGGGDMDADGRVTLAEAYAYAYRRTLWRAGTSAGLQHPTMATELSGAGEVVFTRPASAAAAIEVPSGADRYLVFSLPSAAVMGELPGEGGARLALPSGRYLVARHARRAASVSLVDLSWGGRRRLVEGDFRPVAREELVARGGEVEVRGLRVEPRVGVEQAWRSTRTVGWVAGLAFARTLGAFELELAAGYVSGAANTPAWRGREQSLLVVPGFGRRWFLGPVTASASLGLDFRLSWQRLAPEESVRAGAAGFATEVQRRYFALGPRLAARASIPVGERLSLAAGASATGLARRELSGSGQRRLSVAPTTNVTFGAAFTF